MQKKKAKTAAPPALPTARAAPGREEKAMKWALREPKPTLLPPAPQAPPPAPAQKPAKKQVA